MDAIRHICIGTISLIVCCLIYLAWWSIAFHPLRQYPFAPKIVLFVLTALAGAIGIVFLVWGMRSAPVSIDGISNAVIIIWGIAAYVLLLFLTSKLFHRTVTTELLLIVGWTILELCVVNSLYRSEFAGINLTIIFAVTALAVAIVGMICYLAYYNLEKMRAFYIGMVPLALCAVYMAIQLAVVKSQVGVL